MIRSGIKCKQRLTVLFNQGGELMWNKKYFIIFIIIINVITIVFTATGAFAALETCTVDTVPACTCYDGEAPPCPAGDEQLTLINTLPDALILLDLSGSMAQTPAGDATYFYGSDTSCVANTTLCNNPNDTYYVYSSDNTCTPDTVNCPGSNDTTHTYIYGHDATCTANTTAGTCVGTGSGTYIYAADNSCTANATAGACVGAPTSTYKYAHDTSCTTNTTYCKNSYSDCSGGFCSGSSHSSCSINCSNSSGNYGYCSGGFCGTSKTGCSTNCSNSSGKYGYCSGGFCGTSKTGCNIDCNCQNGMCHNSKTNCTSQCYTNHCTNGFCKDTAQGDCQTDCSKLAIAKRSLFNILDDDNSGIIDVNDATSLGIRIGYMRFYNCSGDESSLSYTSGCNTLVDIISDLGSTGQTSYQLTYCGNSTSCASTVTSCTSGNCIAGEKATGGTVLASALKEAKLYLDAHKAADPYKGCRAKFVIVMTDGADTYACSGDGTECQQNMYTRRREVVAATKQLADAGYKVFVVGFGSGMPAYLQNTLNWMAYYGGEDSPASNSGSKTAYNIPSGGCNLTSSPANCFPLLGTTTTRITSCQTDSSTITTSDCGSSTSGFEATYDDPGYLNLSGYAFIATSADDLTQALKNAFNTIKEATYSFTQASVQAARTKDENFIYEASYEPLNGDPFWIGHLKRYSINNDGTVHAASDWDAGAILQALAEDGVNSPRKIYTTDGTSSALKTFTFGNLSNAILGVTTDTKRTNLIKFIRMGDYNYPTGNEFKNCKLGDILHTSPMSIPSPNQNFRDYLDPSNVFATFQANHQRSSVAGNRLIIVGANDGQLHAFKTGEAASGGGAEVWSFIPPNLVPRLSYMTHSSHPATQTNHTYFVDGPLSAADVWLGTGNLGSAKSVSDWHTLLVMSEGRGGVLNLWSSSTACDSGYSSTYVSPYTNYCGYYALDTTEDTPSPPSPPPSKIPPVFKWRLGGASGLASNSINQPQYLGQPWSKMFMGRIRIYDHMDTSTTPATPIQVEKWVGLIGGGYSGSNCSGTGTCATAGKGFYVVDLNTGAIIWSYTHAQNGSMDYDLPAGPTALDYDSDGLLDTAYVGDTGGNVWRFKFCLNSSGATCGSSLSTDWKGNLLFAKPSTTLGIYTAASLSTDSSQNLWVYFGTGDKTNPQATTLHDRIYAVKDSDPTRTYQLSDLTDITSGTYTDSSSGHGWYITLPGAGEKLMAAPVVYDKKVYFTTYTPNTTDPCNQNGIAKLYVVDYITGAGLLAGGMTDSNGNPITTGGTTGTNFSTAGGGVRWENLGGGTPSGAVVSVNPYGGLYDIYVSTSAPLVDSQGNIIIDAPKTNKASDPSPLETPTKSPIYWHDLRVQ
jgi:Tfp pilus tip-associated adhesin PilY1